MIKKAKAAFQLLQAGRRVANPAAWKKGQVAVGLVSAFFSACVAAVIAFTGTDVQVGQETIDSLSASLVALVPAVVGVWDSISTVITTNKIGLQPKPKPDSEQ
jgi:hypothetical protein